METKTESRVEPSAEESGIFSKAEIAYGDDDIEPNLSDQMLENKLAEKKKQGTTFAVSERTLKDHQIKIIASAAWIKNLDLIGCEIENKSLSRLASLKLAHINLDSSNLTDAGAKELVQCAGLSDISLNSTKVTDDGIKSLTAMKGLQKLALSNTALTDKGLVELSKSESLNYVKFDKTLVTFGGIEQFCQNSKNCKTVLIRQCQNINSKHLEQLKREFPNVEFQWRQ